MSTPQTPTPPSDAAGAAPGVLTEADLPPSPPPSKRRGMGSLRSMVISMAVLCAMLFAFVAIVPRPEKMDRLPVDAVVAVKSAREISHQPFAALEPTPAGWSANSALYAPDADGLRTWTVGYVHDGVYAGVKQVPAATDGWFAKTLADFRRDGTRTLDGIPWEQWVNPTTNDHRLVRRATGSGLTTVLTSSVSYDDAAVLRARLTPKP